MMAAMATGTDAPAGRTATPGWAAGERLPVAPRQRRPGLVVLAVVLILGGALFSAALVLRSGQKQSVVVVTRDVPAGQRFVSADFGPAQVAPGALPVVTWPQVRQLIGKTAAADIKSGTLLNPALVGNDPLPRVNSVNAAAALKAGQLPSLVPGDLVRVLWTPQPGLSSDEAPNPPLDGVVVNHATVYSVSGVRPDGTIVVTLVIPESKQSGFARFASRQSISLVKLHQGG
jgi:hypothetical protein